VQLLDESYNRNSSGYKSPLDKSSDKFGFSTLQYWKLQIIKSIRSISIWVILETTWTMPNKFYCNVMKCLLHILRILRGKSIDESELWLSEHEEIMEFYKDWNFKIH